jgi:hypothetical protein
MAHNLVQPDFQEIIISYQTNWLERVKLSGASERCSVIISAGALCILNKDSCGFSQYLKANCRLEPLNTLQQPSAPFEFITHFSSYNSRLQNLR